MSLPVRGIVFLVVFGLALPFGLPDFGGASFVSAKEKEKEKSKEKEKKGSEAKKGNDTKKDGDKADDNEISMEIDVLSALRRFNPTPDQLKYLVALAKDTAQPSRKRQPAKITDKYHQVLVKLLDAYLHNDDAKIDSLEEEQEKLRDTSPPEMDDLVEITDAARGKAPDLMRQFTAPQAHIYMIQMEVQDPFEQIMIAMDDSQTIMGDDWNDLRDSHAAHIAWLIAGADVTKSAKTRAQITKLLEMSHEMKADDFKKSVADLEKTAHKIVGGVDAIAVLRNTFEYHLANLLSNPKLQAAIEARKAKE